MHTFQHDASAFTSANGDGEIRSLDPLLARQVLSQLSYTPMDAGLSFRTSLPVFSFVCSLSGLGLSEPFPISLRLWMNFTCFSLLGVGLSGLEPPTSRLSGVRSNQLSYKPIFRKQRLTGIFSQLNSCFAFVKVREAPRTKFMLRFTARIH